jgi:hypothetical protein
VSGSGGLCGSAFLDRRFELYMRKLLGDKTIDAMSVYRVLSSPNMIWWLIILNTDKIQERDDAHLDRKCQTQGLWRHHPNVVFCSND